MDSEHEFLMGKGGTLWHGGGMRSTECLTVAVSAVIIDASDNVTDMPTWSLPTYIAMSILFVDASGRQYYWNVYLITSLYHINCESSHC